MREMILSPKRIVLQLVLLSLFLGMANAAPPVSLTINDTPSCNLSGYLYILNDPTRQLTVQQAANRNDWSGPIREAVPNLGITQAAVWLRFSITNQADTSQKLYVSFEYPVVNFVSFYVEESRGVFREAHAGGNVPASAQLMTDRHFLFPLTIKTGKTSDVYLRLQNMAGMTIPIRILTDQALSRKAIRDYTLYGALFGILALILVYFIAVSSFLYKGTSLWLALYCILFGLHTAVRAGFIRLIMPDELIAMISIFHLFIIAGLFFTGAKFFRVFLSLNKHSKYADLIMAFFQYLSIAFILIPLLPGLAITVLSIILFVINPAFSICLAFYLWRKGVSNGGYFAIGWIVAHFVSIYDFFRINGVLPYPVLGEWLIPFSFLIALLFLSVALIRQNAYDHLMAGIDPLTYLANRRKFDEELYNEWNRCLRQQTPISLIMADVDHFKNYNDSFGHEEGDQCLRRIADVLKQNARRTGDLAVRYGGEEFILLLPNLDAVSAFSLAEAIRNSVGLALKTKESQNPGENITISLGISTMMPKEGIKPESLVLEADKAMYEAKRGGRNRTVASSSGGA